MLEVVLRKPLGKIELITFIVLEQFSNENKNLIGFLPHVTNSNKHKKQNYNAIRRKYRFSSLPKE